MAAAAGVVRTCARDAGLAARAAVTVVSVVMTVRAAASGLAVAVAWATGAAARRTGGWS